MPEWRSACGWSTPDYGCARLITAPSKTLQDALLDQVHEFDVNIFSGIAAYPLVRRAFRHSCGVSTTRGIMAEASDWRGWKGTLRMLRGRAGAYLYRDKISFILAIGSVGQSWYRNLGYPEEKIYPYGYFVDAGGFSITDEKDARARAAREVELVYVGRLVRLKGIDVLLSALADLVSRRWRLTLVGEGPTNSELTKLVRRLELNERVRFVGALGNSDAMSLVSAADLLVLPSYMDGWGAVTSEALMRGVPVVCSDQCGSSVLLQDAWRGSVFPAGNIRALRSVLAAWIDKGPRNVDERRRIQAWSARIEPSAAADYVLAVIAASQERAGRPDAPWVS